MALSWRSRIVAGRRMACSFIPKASSPSTAIAFWRIFSASRWSGTGQEAREHAMDAFKPLIAKVARRASLSREEAYLAFDLLLSGEVTPAQVGAFLLGLSVRGETIEEITGAV